MTLAGTVRTAFSYCIGEDSIHPLTGDLVEHTVELAHCDGFGVEDVGVYLIVALVLEGGQGVAEDVVSLGLTTTSRTN